MTLILPLNKKGICGITDIRCLRVCNPSFNASTSPMRYSDPIYGSAILNSAWMMEVFPAPVLPTIPTFSPSLILNERFFKTRGRPSLYLIEKFLNLIIAFYGHYSSDSLILDLLPIVLPGIILLIFCSRSNLFLNDFSGSNT